MATPSFIGMAIRSTWKPPGFRDEVWLDVEGSPLTSSGKMTVRFTRTDYGDLEITVTVEDPKAYAKPWTVKVHHA